jgi:basic membrane protein A
VTNETQFEQAHRRFAQRGQDPIVGVGFNQTNPVEKVAKEFPKIHFTIIDGLVKLPNVQSVLFKEHEGSFLVGLLAAMASKTGKVGFIGGMDIPLIRRFACGYEQGIKYANPKAELIQNMTGTTPAAWNDPARGGELAKGQFDRGVDVVYAAAGGTGNGVMQAAKDRGKLAIGVDSNQNHLHPGTILTSMVKRVDLATYESFKAAMNDSWQPGMTVLGLKEGGVDWALDQHNASLITPEMKAKVDQAKADIISGKIAVHDYMSNNTCAY